jgi:hypothetical protein
VGIAAIGSVGIHHCGGTGEDGLAFMVIRNDQTDPQTVTQLCFLNGGDTAVYGNDQPNPLLVKLEDRSLV